MTFQQKTPEIAMYFGLQEHAFLLVSSLALYPSIAVANPSAIEGQTPKILTSRTGLWARCSTSLLEIEKYLMRRLAETKRSIIPATYWHIYLFIYLFIIYFYLFIYLLLAQQQKILVVLFLSPAAEEAEDYHLGVSDDSCDVKERRFVNWYSLILYQSNW